MRRHLQNSLIPAIVVLHGVLIVAVAAASRIPRIRDMKLFSVPDKGFQT